MIKINKNISEVPECLEKGGAHNCEDVKAELKSIYNNKCCYCETKLSKNYELEHFRPVKPYKWLETDWSKLLLVCSSCNKSKGNRFEVKNKNLTRKPKGVKIHNSALHLNSVERQLLLHPEYDNPEEYFEYKPSGEIKSIVSKKERAEYTIRCVNLQHPDLVRARYEIVENFIKGLNNIISKEEIKTLVSSFRDKCKPENEFSAFRKYILIHYLKSIIFDNLN